MHIDICICTHNPRLDILRKVITSIASQEADRKLFSILLVDNGSKPSLGNNLLTPLIGKGIACRVVQEPKLGLSRARIRAIEETDNEWILFVDDDNELYPDFIKNGIEFIQNHQDVGCFGGRLLLPKNLPQSDWLKPFRPYLGVKDEGDKTLIGSDERWGPEEPPGAGAWVHRKVLNEYLHRSRKDERLFNLGRTGTRSLASCDDSLMMLGSYKIGLKNAYVPNLILYHHLDPKRFRFRYLIRLMYWYGISHVVLEALLKGPQGIPGRRHFLVSILRTLWDERNKSVQFVIGMVAYRFGVRRQYLSQHSENNI